MRLVLLLGIIGSGALAAPDQSLRPIARADASAQVVQSASVTRPVLRPEIELAAAKSLRPTLRPKTFEERAMARRRARNKGAVCGNADIQGVTVGSVPGRGACGIENAVRLREVAGIGLSQQAVMTCDTAKALNTWVSKSVKPAFSRIGGGLSELKVAAHYACRTRNNQPGARFSEHGKGRAIDISAFTLRDGSSVTVLRGWRQGGAVSRALKKVHAGACGPFGTVLGPNSDRFHQDHFHFDTARYRSGPYCR